MSRRDMIIIAVLANIGVLALLFMLAFRTEEEKVAEPTEIAYTLVQERALDPQPEALGEAEIIKPETIDDGDDNLDDAIPNSQHTTEEESIHFAEAEMTPETTNPKPEVPPTDLPVDSNTPKKVVEVTVKKGDALEKIARANGTTVDAIMLANQMKSDKLKVGQVLKVPVNPKSIGVKNPTAAAAKPIAQGDTQYYTVKAGDNPWKIAKQFHLKLDELLKLNNLDEASARNLKIGDKVRVQ